jgi:hypothetical protein
MTPLYLLHKAFVKLWQFENIRLSLIWFSNDNKVLLLCVCHFWLDAVKYLLANIRDLQIKN